MSINLTAVIDNEEAVRKFKELQKTAKTVTSSVITDSDRMDAAMRRIATTLGQIGVGASLVGLVKQIAQTRGEFQQLEVAFTTLLQSKEKADALMAQMVELSAKTPFDLQGVASGARQLLAYGFAAEDVTDVLTRLGNVAAGLGLNLQDLTWLYGTTAVQGRLYTRDVMQFQSRGIDLAGELATMLGKTRAEISQMVTEGKIGFPEVQKAIENMTNEGGKFYNLMQEQSKTITGLISNLGDAIDVMFNDIGKSQEGVITDVLKGTISLVENYQKVLDILIPLVAAYGAYKAALIAVAAAQKVQATIEATKAILEQTKMLTRATQAQILFNKAVKANPYVLAASALIGIVTALTTFSKKAKDTEEIVSDLNATTSEYASNADSLLSLADTYDTLSEKTAKTEAENARLKDTIGKLASAVPSAISQFDEYGRALDVNIEKIRQFNDAQKEALRIDINAQINDAKSKISDIDREIAGLNTIYQDKYYYRNKTTTVGGQLVVLQDLEKVPYSENQIEDAARKANELYAERLKLIEAIEKGENTLAGITSGGQQPGAAAGPIVSATENLKSAQKAYTEAVKAWKAAVSGGENVSVVKEKQGAVDAAKQTLDEAKKLAGVDDKTVKSVTKSQEKLSDLILANDRALMQSRIDVMQEGKKKELAEIDMRTKEELQKIAEDKQKLQTAQGGTLTADQTKGFQERESNVQQKSAEDRAAVELKYAQELDRIYKQITEDTLSEEDRRINAIKEKYEEFRKWVDNALKAGNISQEQATDLGIRIDRAEIAASLNAVVEEYRSAEDRIAKIRQNAENARNAATAGGREDLIPQINKSEAQQVGEIRADELMKTDDWINLFQNLDALSSKEIRRIIDNINAQLKNADLDPINLKTVTDQLQEASDKAAMKNPFAAVVTGFRDYKTAMQEAIRLREKYNQTQQESDRQAADQAELEAIIKKQKAWQNAQAAAAETSQLIGAVSGMLGNMGVDVPAEVEGLMGALDSFASMDITKPFSIVTGAIGGIANLIGGIFGGGNQRIERNIQRLQDQIDALQKSYEDLGDAIENAYSYDASSMILQQNEMIDQQLKLIEQQIAEEKSKKNPDEDALEAYYEQMDELRKQQEKNKELAKDAIFGEDIKSAINDFANAYADAWAAGEDRAKSMKDVVKNMIKNVVIGMLSKDLAKDVEKLRAKLATFLYDGFLDPTEEHIVNDMIDDMVEKGEKYDPILKKYWGTEDTQNTASKGFQAMSQDTGNELNGRFSDMQGKMNILVNGMDMLRSINMDTRNATFDMRDIMIQLNGNVADIRTYTRILPEMAETLTSMNRKLDNL